MNPSIFNNKIMSRPFRDSAERNQYNYGTTGGNNTYTTSAQPVGGYTTGTTSYTQGAPTYSNVGTTYTQGGASYSYNDASYGNAGTTYAQGTTTYAGGNVLRPSGVTTNAGAVRTSIPVITTNTGAPVVTNVGHSTLIGGYNTTTTNQSYISGRPTTGRVSTRELDTKVNVVVGDRRLVGREARQSFVKGVNVGESRLIRENRIEGGIVNVSERRGEAVVRSGVAPQAHTRVNTVETYAEEAVIVERIVEKPVEVIIQRKVPVERYVDVPYDVYVERPVEKLIQREIIIEKVMERPREKIVEIPVEVIYEIPVEKIIERRIEYETIVEVPVERIVERRVEEIIENVRYNDRVQEVDSRDLNRYQGHEILPTEVRTVTQDKVVERPVYHTNVVEKIVNVPVERVVERVVDKVIEIPVERIVERPRYVDNIVTKIVEVPVPRTVEKPVEQVIERQVYYDNIIERPVPVERIVERKVEIAVDRIVEIPVYVDNIIQKTVERYVEVDVPYEQVIENVVEQTTDNSVPVVEFSERLFERVYERPIKQNTGRTVPVELVIEKDVYVPREQTVEVQIPQIIGKIIERDITRPANIERITERPVAQEKIIEVPLRRIIEVPKFVENEVVREVPFEQIIERIIERIIPREVEVRVDKVIEVPVTIRGERAVTQERVEEQYVDFEARTLQAVPGRTTEEASEVTSFPNFRLKTQFWKRTSERTCLKPRDSSLRTKDSFRKPLPSDPRSSVSPAPDSVELSRSTSNSRAESVSLRADTPSSIKTERDSSESPELTAARLWSLLSRKILKLRTSEEN